ncbi:LOB domain-containing protein 1 [Hibiscus syriacus]|uniref:LOB domain-containing protein 1 n=1 Tax=Hibiscus syriacus TaxID=106335 RepID=A0A6A3BJ38_HIBSY|nr:LOB domain-containing protein 1 [Hibiscus syriacus]
MENNEKCAQFSSSLSPSPSSSPRFPSPSSQSPPQPASPTPPSTVVLSPCAACKILRRRCVEKCVLAPYFPPTEPYKFTIAHRVFGASNIIKSLQASARIRDPVYGCAGAICQLQKQVSELQAQLAKAQAETVTMQCQQANLHGVRGECSNPRPVYGCAGAICQLQKKVSELQAQLAKAQAETVTMQCQQANLVAIILEMTQSKEPNNINSQQVDTTCFLDDNNLASAWEPLWT